MITVHISTDKENYMNKYIHSGTGVKQLITINEYAVVNGRKVSKEHILKNEDYIDIHSIALSRIEVTRKIIQCQIKVQKAMTELCDSILEEQSSRT